MMIMLRIPENKHRVQLRGSHMAVLLSYCTTTWLGEDILSHQQRQKQNPKEQGRQYCSRNGGLWLSCGFFYSLNDPSMRKAGNCLTPQDTV